MAKKLNKVTLNLLAAIVNATKNNEIYYVTKEEAESIGPDYIEVNTGMIQDGKAASRATPAGIEMSNKAMKNDKKSDDTPTTSSQFAMIGGIELPKSKRGGGGGGAPSKYPFDQLEVGISFFVPVTEKKPEPWKSMQSSVAAANYKYSEGTGEFETVERTKRGKGNKAEVDASGNKIKETKSVEKRKAIRKFVIRQIEKGKNYGGWIAPESGAVIQRTI